MQFKAFITVLITTALGQSGQCYKANKSKTPIAAPNVPAPTTSGGSGAIQARLTNYDSSTGGAACDGVVYSNDAVIVAISSDYRAPGASDFHGNCHRKIRITANGRSTEATVVDMCPVAADGGSCRSGIIDGTNGVWKSLGLPGPYGIENISFSFL